jgi:DNA-binding IclR family transcriptional regulator
LSVSRYFRLTTAQARTLVAEVEQATSGWRREAEQLGLPRQQIDRMSDAFETSQRRIARLVERLSAHRAGRVLYRIGGRMPMHATGVGLVLLAHAPAQVQQEVLAGDLSVEPGHALASERELRVLLAAIRRDGVATVSRQRPEPMTSVAAPVLNNRRVVAALSVVAQSGNLQPAALTPAVVAVARAISRAVSAVSAGLPRPVD